MRADKQERNVLVEMLATFSILTTMLDSGGELGLRTIGLLALVATFWRNPCFSLRPRILLVWFGITAMLVPSVMRSAFQGVDLKNIVIWIYPILLFPVIYLIARGSRLSEQIFVNAGLCFGITIVLLFIGRITGNEALMWLNDKLTANASGFFNQKQVFFEDATPVVYFQGTLTLVFVSVLAAGRKQYIKYAIMLLALAVAPSRFGVVVSVISAFGVIFFQLESRRKQTLVIGFAILLFVSVFAVLPSGFSEIFNRDSSGSQTRIGHLRSIAEVIENDPTVAMIGAGPGSTFYSQGFGDFTDNIEISQLEIIRKYGILFFSGLTLFLVWLTASLWRAKRKHTAFSLIAQFVVASSNPVLLASSFVIFISVALHEVEDTK